MNAITEETSTQFRSTSGLIGGKIESVDEEVCGKCRDFLFDDENWTIRYIVADTGSFLDRHEVLLSPFVFSNPEFGAYESRLPTVLNKDWIEASPRLETDAPVSQQFEEELARHFNYPLYWSGAGLWGLSPYPTSEVPSPDEMIRHEHEMEEIRESRLRSCDEITSYRVFAGDEEIGKVDDFIVETKPWRIRYFVVDTGNWMRGRRVTLSPDWVDAISWTERVVRMDDFVRSVVEEAPTFDPATGINRDYEGALHDYYGRPRYW